MRTVRRGLFFAALALTCGLILPWAVAAGRYGFKTAHYVVETTVSQDLAGDIAEHMEILHAGYTKIFSGRPRIGGQAQVCVYKNMSEYQANGGPPNSGGVHISGPGVDEIRSFNSPALRGVLAHEGFHQFYARYLGSNGEVQWINEGLAELFRNSLIDGAEIKSGLVTKPDADTFKKMAEDDKLLSPKELLTMDNATWNNNLETNPKKALCQYYESRFLVHFLRFAGNEKYVNYLNKYIKAVQLGKAGGEAVGMAFGKKFPDVAKEFNAWTQNELKPCAPECCSANLFHLAQLLYEFRKGGGKFEGLEDLLQKVKSNKDIKWRVVPITRDSEHSYGPDNMDVVEKWFTCPKCAKGYELLDDPDAPEEGLPMIVCYGHHKKLAVCASFEKQKVFSNRDEMVWPVVLNRQIQSLKKLAKKTKKEAKD